MENTTVNLEQAREMIPEATDTYLIRNLVGLPLKEAKETADYINFAAYNGSQREEIRSFSMGK